MVANHSFTAMKVWIVSLGLIIASLSACQSAGGPAVRLDSAQVSTLKALGFQRTDEGWEFSASEKLLFATNEATLKPDARQIVERIGKELVSIQIERVRADGHTDSEGNADYNEQLSFRRATAVANALIRMGMRAQWVTVRGRGMTAPIADNRTADGRAQNRRVSIVITAD